MLLSPTFPLQFYNLFVACGVDSHVAPVIQCKYDTLVVQYRTDVTFNGVDSTISRRLQADLTERLIKKGAMMPVVVIKNVAGP